MFFNGEGKQKNKKKQRIVSLVDQSLIKNNTESEKTGGLKHENCLYQKEVRFVLAVGDIFHVEGNDVFCVASKNRISCPKDMKADG